MYFLKQIYLQLFLDKRVIQGYQMFASSFTSILNVPGGFNRNIQNNDMYAFNNIDSHTNE